MFLSRYQISVRKQKRSAKANGNKNWPLFFCGEARRSSPLFTRRRYTPPVPCTAVVVLVLVLSHKYCLYLLPSSITHAPQLCPSAPCLSSCVRATPTQQRLDVVGYSTSTNLARGVSNLCGCFPPVPHPHLPPRRMARKIPVTAVYTCDAANNAGSDTSLSD